MKKSTLLILAGTCLVVAIPPPHPAVVAVRQQEQTLPPHLRKPALNNPRLWDILPLTSLLHEGESPVFQRDADKVSSRGIYNMLTHAGLVPRRQSHLQGLWNQGQSHRPWNQRQNQGPWPQSPGEFNQVSWQQAPKPLSNYAPGHYYEEQAYYELQSPHHQPQHFRGPSYSSSPEHLQYL